MVHGFRKRAESSLRRDERKLVTMGLVDSEDDAIVGEPHRFPVVSIGRCYEPSDKVANLV